MRIISDLGIIKNITEKFCSILEKHCKYIVVSGLVAISTGRSRGTEDVDVIIERIPLEKFASLHTELEADKFECIQEKNASEIYTKYLADKLPVRYTWNGQVLPEMELKMSKDFLDDSQLQNRVKIPESVIDVWFSSIETNLAFKEELLKSDKDLEDARHLRNLFSERIDESKIVKLKELIRKYRLKIK